MMTGSDLELSCPRTPLAEELLGLFRDLMQTDEAFVARLRRHYALFKKLMQKNAGAKSK